MTLRSTSSEVASKPTRNGFVHPSSDGRKSRLKERALKSNYFRSTIMAQVTYRGIKYNTNDKKQTKTNKVQETYRGVKFEKDLATA